MASSTSVDVTIPSTLPYSSTTTAWCWFDCRNRSTSRRIVVLSWITSGFRSEEHTSELQSLMRISYAVFCLKKKKPTTNNHNHTITNTMTSNSNHNTLHRTTSNS